MYGLYGWVSMTVHCAVIRSPFHCRIWWNV